MTRLLLVEDDHFDRLLFSKRLGLVVPDWVVEEAGDLTQAVELLGRSTYDVVVTDLMLPDADGDEVLRGLVDAGAGPLIVLSGLSKVDLRAWPGVVERIEKADFDTDAFVAIVRAIG